MQGYGLRGIRVPRSVGLANHGAGSAVIGSAAREICADASLIICINVGKRESTRLHSQINDTKICCCRHTRVSEDLVFVKANTRAFQVNKQPHDRLLQELYVDMIILCSRL